MTTHHASRRAFLRQLGALGALGAAAPFGLNLAAMGNAAAAGADEYRALVCLFLLGGNDHYNTVIPFDAASYQGYSNARSPLALPLASLQQLNASNLTDGRQFAVPAELAPLQKLFEQGKAAVVANVGTLVAPIANAAEYRSGKVPVPPKLFSHNDQQAIWQALSPEGARIGWGGRMGDLLMSQNTAAQFTAVSAASNAVFLSGQKVKQYQIGSSGPVGINSLNTTLYGSTPGSQALRALITQSRSHLLQDEHNRITQRSIDAFNTLNAALAGLPASDARVALSANLASNRLAQQLQIVARMIGINQSVGVKRQVFFVSLGGFDTHDNQLATQAGLHNTLAQAVEYFYNATVQLGLANQVTLFTASDFGRTLASNGDGSDHGWGSHQFVVGGAVKGKQIVGTMPISQFGTAEDVGSGRLLPSIAVDQYAATLGRWLGVADSDLPLVLPNIGRFATSNLGFL
ncbi:uncharacterized protein (DUF1501 family) [Chitinivorax tropicus]|uniref:Uncharacterized protein (DUF1501 family) n=1 Tax=Chitinivorax tropicus TaxID=714531 RepID=A0A840MRW4_9PROT|nr:DUF1501 domain-containing protein [Chitinivorax tropicus]MBB5018993.1 uncharacterized protein (DUF1501 family) [Chitinivorax tropicus]